MYTLERLLVLVFISGHVYCLGQEKPDSTQQLTELKTQMREMQRHMEEMRSQHAKEIGALNEKFQTLQAGKGSPIEGGGDLDLLRRLAETEASQKLDGESRDPSQVFKDGGLSLQALNPEISVTGDMLAFYRSQEDNRQRSHADFRTLGLHFESYLDPYTKFKACVPVDTGSASLGEAYMTHYGLADGLNVTFGKFRQQFGVVNRWHKHGLDQVDFPLALREIFGNGGLNQTGISLDYTLPSLFGSSQDLTLQVTNGENPRLFSGNLLGVPSLLLHYKNFRELNKDTYFEFGLTALGGWRDAWDVWRSGVRETEYDSKSARVFGLDFSFLWEPTDRMRYRNIEWRTELYLLNRDILSPNTAEAETINAYGAYTYFQTKLNRKLSVGFRADYYKPDRRDYGGLETLLTPLAYRNEDAHRWQVGPYLTWSQSPFVKYRVEYNHAGGKGMEKPDDILWLQLIFAAGPHKHERY